MYITDRPILIRNIITEEYCLLGCNGMKLGGSLPMFRRNILLPFLE
jgi:hypothetical protein